jgi:hypothetical protein
LWQCSKGAFHTEALRLLPRLSRRKEISVSDVLEGLFVGIRGIKKTQKDRTHVRPPAMRRRVLAWAEYVVFELERGNTMRDFKLSRSGKISYIFTVRSPVSFPVHHTSSPLFRSFSHLRNPLPHKSICRNQFTAIFGSGHAVHAGISLAITHQEE